MIRTYAQKLTPPYSGQVQIVETDTYRALTLDGMVWEVQYVNRIHIRVCTISSKELHARAGATGQTEDDTADPKLAALFDYLVNVKLPFLANDHLEFWLLDDADKSPLALIYSCSTTEKMEKFPERAWYPNVLALTRKPPGLTGGKSTTLSFHRCWFAKTGQNRTSKPYASVILIDKHRDY